MKAILILPSGATSVVNWTTLEDMQQLVGGYIELLRCREGFGAYVNEDGKAMGLPFNPKATNLCVKFLWGGEPLDKIVGSMVLVGPGTADGDDTDVPDWLIKDYVK